jgi:16S rRNA (guanine966-N2)-methyltransferase
MRVIAGEFRSRVLTAPNGMATRPTSDRLRETLFNVLAPRIEGARFLDLFAGSGAVGIEALSRGAAEVVCVERAAPAVKVLRHNLDQLGIRDRIRVQAASAATFLRSSTAKFDIVFLDPPYDAAEEYEKTLRLLGTTTDHPISPDRDRENALLADGALVIAEHRRKERLQEQYGALLRSRLLEQGDAALSFYSLKNQ